MAAPLPEGSRLSVFPTAPSINPMQGVVDTDPMGSMSKGIDFAGQFARLGQLKSKIELENAQRKADMAKAKAQELEMGLIQRDLEDKYNIEKAQRAAELETQLEILKQQQNATRLGSLSVPLEDITGMGSAFPAAADNPLAAVEAPGETPLEASEQPAISPELSGAIAALNPDAPTSAPGFTQPTQTASLYRRAKESGTGPDFPVAEIPAGFSDLSSEQRVAQARAQAFDRLNKIYPKGVPLSKAAELQKQFLDEADRLTPKEETETREDRMGNVWTRRVVKGPNGEYYQASEPTVKTTGAQKEMDDTFAKALGTSIASPGTTVGADTNMKRLKHAAQILYNSKNDLLNPTGKWQQFLPDKVYRAMFPEGASAQDSIREVVQQSLRETLGAQFARVEGEMMMERAFSPGLSPEENLRRVGLLAEAVSQVTAARKAAKSYFKSHGTLLGFEGGDVLLPSSEDNPGAGAVGILDQLIGKSRPPVPGAKVVDPKVIQDAALKYRNSLGSR